MTTKPGFVVVGAGQAAGRAIQTIRTNGYEGVITLIGDEQALPYERPALSKEVLQQDSDHAVTYVLPNDWYLQNKVDLVLNTRAEHLNLANKTLTCSNGQTYCYEKLLLTTGARLRHLHLAGATSENTYYLRTLEDARKISEQMRNAKTLAVIGGGFIGLEVASSGRSRGLEVSVIEAGERLLGRAVPAEISRLIADKHCQEGVNIHLNSPPECITEIQGQQYITLINGEQIQADLIIVGIGITPEVSLAEAAGLTVDNGIITDQQHQTSDPDVYAAGDCASHFNHVSGKYERLESWQNAQNQAIAAGLSMCNQPIPEADTPWFWSDQYDLNLQAAGQVSHWQQRHIRGDADSGSFILLNIEEQILTGAIGINSAREMSLISKMIATKTTYPVNELTATDIPLKRLFKSYR